MTVKSLCSFNRSSGRDGAVKTAIKLKTAPDIVPLTRQNRPLFEVPSRRTNVKIRSFRISLGQEGLHFRLSC
jgi:hypothetical protein